MKRRDLLLLCLIIAICGILIILVANLTSQKSINLYEEDFINFEFEKNKKYFVDANYIEIIGDYFYKENIDSGTIDVPSESHDFYYNIKIVNKDNQELYMIMVLNDGARTNMLNGNLRDDSGIIKQVSTDISNKQIISLKNNDISGEDNVYNYYLETSDIDSVNVIGYVLIITSIIVLVIGNISLSIYKK